MIVVYNSCSFKIVRYFDDKAVIEIRPINGTFLDGENPKYMTEKIENLTTNFGGGFEEWVKDNF